MGGSSPSSVPGASECRNLVNGGKSDRVGRVSLAQHQCGQALAPEARTAPNPALRLALTSTPSVGPLPYLSYPTCLPATRPANSLPQPHGPATPCVAQNTRVCCPAKAPKQRARGGDSSWEGPLSGCPEARRQGTRPPPPAQQQHFPPLSFNSSPSAGPQPSASLLALLSFPPLRLRPDLAGSPVPSHPVPPRSASRARWEVGQR